MAIRSWASERTIHLPRPLRASRVLAFGNSASPQGFTASNGTEYTNLGNQNTGTNYTLNTFLYGDNFTWLKNRHTFKIGVQFLRQQQNNFYPGNDGSLGGFFYLGAGTANPGWLPRSTPATDPTDMRLPISS